MLKLKFEASLMLREVVPLILVDEAFFHSVITDPLRETEARSSGVPFLLDLPRRVFERISFRRLAMLLSALGYSSRNRLSSLPNLDKALESVL
jgi:hypothetical protein